MAARKPRYVQKENTWITAAAWPTSTLFSRPSDVINNEIAKNKVLTEKLQELLHEIDKRDDAENIISVTVNHGGSWSTKYEIVATVEWSDELIEKRMMEQHGKLETELKEALLTMKKKAFRKKYGKIYRGPTE